MSGWTILTAAVEEARAQVAAEAPDPATAAEGEAYVSRVATAAMSTALMGHRLTQGGLAMALPVHGGPNPDYLMRHAPIDPTGHYRLEGRLNGSERVSVGLYTVGRNGAPLLAGQAIYEPGNCGSNGCFTLDIAATANGPETLTIQPGTRILMVRVLHRDASPPAYLTLSGGQEPRGATLVGGSHEAALGFAANTLRANIAEYMKWVKAAGALPNCLAAAPEDLAQTVVGDADTQYFLGGFDLDEGEWLEVTVPGNLRGYWSLHAYNYWYEHLVTPGVHDRNATADVDGLIRIAVGPTQPKSSTNWIDTLGRRKGAFVCRIVGHDAKLQAPLVHVRKLDQHRMA